MEGGEATYGPGHIQTLMSLFQHACLLATEDSNPRNPDLHGQPGGPTKVLDTESSWEDSWDIEGEKLFHRALKGNEAMFGPKHPKTMKILNKQP